jgi:glycosyltransferase involved in cell wall biosynthesis
MTNLPDVSLVLPVYNGRKYLRKSIESILDQTHRNFEFIIWDDESKDDSRAIIAEYEDARIRVFANPRNRGLFPTLNLAMSEAVAPLIRLWSQDDIMKSDCLHEELSFVNSHPDVGMSYCLCDIIDDDGNVIGPAMDYPTPDVISPSLAAQIMLYHGSITGNIANVMLKKSVMEKVGGFREDMRIAGDFEMWVRISEQFPLGFLRLPLVYLRSHAGQFSRQSASYVTCMTEEQTIYAALLERQPNATLEYARKYDRRQRYLQYVHFMVRHFVTGQFKTAFASYRAISRIDNPLLLIGLWLLTADQRLFKMEPKYELS